MTARGSVDHGVSAQERSEADQAVVPEPNCDLAKVNPWFNVREDKVSLVLVFERSGSTHAFVLVLPQCTAALAYYAELSSTHEELMAAV